MQRLSIILLIIFTSLGLLSLYSFTPKKQNAYTEVALGRMLFFDPLLSGDKSVSCASCHIPAYAFADTIAFSKGVNNKPTHRNTPSVMNMASRDALFWDGRAKNLEEQVLFPIADPNEMNCPIPLAIQRLNNSKLYKKWFKKIYNSPPDSITLEKAIAAFERSLETSNTPNDRWLNDKPNGLTEQQIRGRSVFFNKGKCIECHFTPDFTGDEFRNIGLFDGAKWNDSGRYLITKKTEDIGMFKTPGLRNVALTAPYMHDGSFKTLAQVIAYYNNPMDFIHKTVPRDTLLAQPLGLSKDEMQDLESFLKGLTDDAFIK
jgi:cytochrome c peroxidase